MNVNFQIKRLDIFQSYFKGKVLLGDQEFDINIQPQSRGKVLKLPSGPKLKNKKYMVRFTGEKDLFVEDYLPYCGSSEWVEIDSDEITFFLADHQDQLDTLEIIDDPF